MEVEIWKGSQARLEFGSRAFESGRPEALDIHGQLAMIDESGASRAYIN
jgi:hypothetical protein